MPLAIVHSRALNGLDAPPVTVEVHLAGGLPGTTIVGLPEAAVREARDRVKSAIQNSGFDYPARRITVNLAPADLPKTSGRFDLPIALGILAASGQMQGEQLENYEFIGELALSGALRPVNGALPSALAINGQRELILPAENASEAALSQTTLARAASSLLSVSQAFNTGEALPTAEPSPVTETLDSPDLADVRGQTLAKRALEIAAAGGHGMILIGPPGAGKSMLAQRLPGILPPMTQQEAIEAAAVSSIGEGGFNTARWLQRPFRAPHHTASGVALVGGGSSPRPGEISLAHHGVLFLDELPEFERRVLEVLREPLESGRIVISRAARQAEFPARFQLIAAMNPCPCGHLGDPSGRCHCTADQVRRYRSKLSGPLLDRIDLHLEVPRVSDDELMDKTTPQGETSAEIRALVTAARERQLQRANCPNAQLSAKQVEIHCRTDQASEKLLRQALEKLGLSARAYHRILKVARTIADLAAEEDISSGHVAEAIGYRQLDRRMTA